ncbi:hypothetical protein GW7_09509, partial [Heterocephalus glaber]
ESAAQMIPETLAQCSLCLLSAELMVTLKLCQDSAFTPLPPMLTALLHSQDRLASKLTALEIRLLCLSHKQVSPVSCKWRQNMVFKANS